MEAKDKKMKQLFYYGIYLILLCFPLLLSAQEETPHGGSVEAASGLSVEMVKEEGKVLFYVLDNDMNTMNVYECHGKVTFYFPERKKIEKQLKVYSDAYLWARLGDKLGEFSRCKVFILLNGPNIPANMKFNSMTVGFETKVSGEKE